MGLSLGSSAPLNAQQYLNVLLVMTISIMMGIWLVPLIGKKLLGGMSKLSNRDAKWADIFQNSLFIGMISAFLGFVFCDVARLWNATDGYVTEYETVYNEVGEKVKVAVQHSSTSGLIPVCVMLVSVVTMLICGLAMRRPKMKWLSEYALPISLIAGMAAAIPITAWLG